ncbi:transposase [Sulfolobus acidocaldarius]|uniref:Transposase n=3 Tax=Sulfolobus acidocaldarius TaxID=2285 RepID=A0A0U2X0D2_9CREN|nr:transposase [Sulfolobus acidocaldarius N8]AGE72750.1 transposase [Sulfolobus acidocaldarius Ron12/I]ALU29149.1 transposase [Sulfolobus acidocaldarius]ALU31874.1 transposase [Sulfolobus acidocaldarius]WCM34467.1 transposase [Sulfolobus acidocaldarius DSM 639]
MPSIHTPESQGGWSEGNLTQGIGVKWLKTQPVVYRWTSGAGWVLPTSCEAMKMKVVNHKPMNRPRGTLAL